MYRAIFMPPLAGDHKYTLFNQFVVGKCRGFADNTVFGGAGQKTKASLIKTL
jgi:hypothetical protein